MMRHALWVGFLIAACKGKPAGGEGGGSGSGAGSGSGPAARAPVDMARATATLGCLFDRARTPREVVTLAAAEAPVPIARMVALAAVERARRDGETPTVIAISDALDELWKVDDVDGMRALFALLDAIPSAKTSTRTTHQGPMRARVGLPVTAGDRDADKVAMVRELALAGKRSEASALFGTLRPREDIESYELEPYLGALVALGLVDDAKKLVAAAPADEQLRYAGMWLLFALRGGGTLTEPLAVVRSELSGATEKQLSWFDERAIFRAAQRARRGAELAELYRAVKKQHAAFGSPQGRSEMEYDLARALGDEAELTALAKAPELQSRHLLHRGPFDRALAAVLASKYPTDDLVRLWIRSIAEGAEPAWGAVLATGVCGTPKAAAAPATPAQKGLTLTVTEKKKKAQFECANHDVVVRLANGDSPLGEEVLEGQCSGACTAAEQREGKKQLAEIEAAIARGEASESQTDYNFTQCLYAGPNIGRIDKVGDRDVALLVDHYIGAHDIDKDRYQLALEVCGQLHITQTFGQTYAGSWELKELSIKESADKQMIVVEGASDRWTGVLFRLRLPACPGEPVEEAIELEM